MPDIIETTDAAASTATTYTLGIGQIAQGQLSSSSDHDWYRVNLVAGQTYSFAMTGTGTNNAIDTYLRLYAADGTTVVAQNDDGLPNANSVFTYTAASTGAYYIDAADYQGPPGPSGTPGQYGVAVTLGTRPSFDIQMGAGVIDTNASWSATPGTAATVTYGFRQSAATYTATGSDISTFSQVTASEMAAIQSALQLWSDVANITFTQVNPGGYTDNAAILYANYNDSTDGAGAFAYYPGSTASNNQAGDVWLNTSVSRTTQPFGSYSFEAILHETGHALGLSHPGLYNAAPGVSITYANNAQFIQDSNQYSVMSYFDESNTGGNDNGYPSTPMLFDVYALQQIYGANMTTRTGDTVYGFGSNAGAVFDFAIDTSPAICIWDAGGTDTLNCANYTQTELINLNAGTFSNIGGLTANVSIALGATIENAVGGSGSDTIVGNAADNKITGNGGSDTIDGGAGTDTAVYGGTHLQYQITQLMDGSVRLVDQRASSPDGTDTDSNVELFQFSDGVFTLSQLIGGATPPTITSNGGGDTATVAVAENSTAVATVTATDPDVGATLAYSLIGGSDQTRFQINSATGALSFVSAPNFEAPTDSDGNNSYIVQVRATDNTGLFDTQTITVNVTNVNEVPTITSNGAGDTATVAVAENSTAATTVAATDPDAGTTLTYSLVGGSDQARFQINSATGALSFVSAPNFEAPTDSDGNNSYVVQVRATDNGGLFDTQTITVNVTNVNEVPTITSNGAGDTATIGVAENSTAVTTVTATDPDAGTALSYSLVGGSDQSQFHIDAATGALSFVTEPNFEAPTDSDGNNSYVVQVRATDNGGLFDTQTITINVTNVIEPTSDFDGDGKSDILWGNGSGAVTIWKMNGTQLVAVGDAGSNSAGWHIAGTDDFNGDGKSDILWRSDSGAVTVWEMNGTQLYPQQALVAPPPIGTLQALPT